MLVEDNISDSDLTRRAFQKNNIANELVVTQDGQEALDYLFGEGTWTGRNVQDTPIIVLLDLSLPGMNGLEVLRRIRDDERTKRLPVVILTSSKEEADVGAGYDLGVNSYIRKPVDFFQFLDVIKTVGLYWLAINEGPRTG
nr:response regulator [Duganella flavida]